MTLTLSQIMQSELVAGLHNIFCKERILHIFTRHHSLVQIQPHLLSCHNLKIIQVLHYSDLSCCNFLSGPKEKHTSSISAAYCRKSGV